MAGDPKPSDGLTRRRMLAGLGLAAGYATAAVVWPPSATAAAQPTSRTWPARWAGNRSSNGWPLLATDSRQLNTVLVEGSDVSTTLAAGMPTVLLTYVLRRFHYEVMQLEPGVVVGHVEDRRVATEQSSNHLSATAVDVSPGHFPPGRHGSFYDSQLLVIRDILASCAGAVRWGGDDALPTEGHFRIAAGPNDPALQALERRSARDPARFAVTASSAESILLPERLRAAADLAAVQRRP